MTISSTTLRKEYNGNGVTTSFSFPYRFLADSHLVVYVNDVLQTLTTDYTVTGAGGPSGGSVVFGTAPATGTGNVVILNNPPQTQELDLVENDPLPAEEVEKAFDLAAIRDQRLQDQLDRAFKLADTDTSGASTELPAPAAANLIGWNANANALQNYSADALGIEIAYASWVTETFSGDTLATDFVLVGDPAVASNCDVSISGVSQTADLDFTYTRATRTVSFASAPPAGTDNIAVRYGSAVPVGAVPAGSVDTTQLVDGSVTPAKLSTGAPSWNTSGDFLLNKDATSALHAVTKQQLDAVQASSVQVGDDIQADNISNAAGTGAPNFPNGAKTIRPGTAVASTSGTAIDFTSIPSGVRRITVMLNGVSTSGTSQVQIQIGSGSVSTTGYASAAGYGVGTGQYVSSTTGFAIDTSGSAAAATLRYGTYVLSLLGSNVWTGLGGVYATTALTNVAGSGCSPSLSGAIDRVRITTVGGADTFDAGTINISWEF